MPPNVSFISDVAGDVNIGGGSLTLNVWQSNGLARHDFDRLLDSGMHCCEGDIAMLIKMRGLVANVKRTYN